MPYNVELASRVREILKRRPRLEEKKMFGGVGFLVNGNMACGVHGEGLIVRVAPEKHAQLLTRPHTRPFDLTGKPMKGWLIVEAGGWKTEAGLKAWVKEGLEFAVSLPVKKK